MSFPIEIRDQKAAPESAKCPEKALAGSKALF
jgi:hypothetical protein